MTYTQQAKNTAALSGKAITSRLKAMIWAVEDREFYHVGFPYEDPLTMLNRVQAFAGLCLVPQTNNGVKK